MSGLNERREAMDAKLAHSSELQFKVNNRRNKLLGLWLAEQFGLSGDEAEAYAKTVVMSDFDEPGDDDVVRKVLADIAEKGASIDEAAVRSKMSDLLGTAKDQVFEEKD